MVRPTGAGNGDEQGECYRFGEVVVDVRAHTITRAGQAQSVEPKAFAVLLVLLRHADQLVLRDVLLDEVWGHRHVTPNVLTRAIAQLRAALGDHPHQPEFIQTQHALGYRFIGQLIEDPAACPPVADEDVPQAPAPVAEPAEAMAAPERFSDRRRPVVEPGKTARSGRRLWLGAGLAAVLVAAGAAWFLYPSAPGHKAADPSVAVLPFATLGGASGDDYFARGLAVEMHDALAGVPGLKVAAYPSLDGARQDLDAVSVGKRLGVATVLDATVRREGKRVRVNARLTDTRTGFTLWAQSYDRRSSDLLAVQSEIGEEVVRALLGVLPEPGRPALQRRLAPTRNLAAYDLYLKGLGQLRQPGTAPAAAIASFRQALAGDATFARAQAGICRGELLQFEAERNAAAFARASSACTQAERMDPRLREVSLAMGEMHRISGDLEAATRAYTRALEDISLRPDAYIGLARVENSRERNDVAMDYIERAHQLRPGDAQLQRERGYLHYLQGNLPAAIDAYRIATTLEPDDAATWSSLGGLQLTKGDAAAAASAFLRSLSIEPSYGALSNLGTLRYEEGRYAEAAALYRQAAALNAEDFRIFGNIGDALSAQSGATPEARAAYGRAAAMAGRYAAVKTDDSQAMALLAWYSANLGQAEAARQWLAKAEALRSEEGEVALLAAQTLARLEDGDAARARLVRARNLQVPERRIRASPLLRRLGGPGNPSGARAAHSPASATPTTP
ncbi:winged helix-turn-helix domain-containing protein [Agrilutibacter solisilvae]|uniref:Winged helix-turn-helix domain-containing protein n=1 Tax=Agrilutibacter solisilvae TaxID=2763317 RepID=A0A974XYK6_9GAMM|nr:winged helix-turn-helix domain-containing protein [Lysobacter solisilvae]QSX77235.1 winged helix-turn-helix domain-containing protein [Lysobacter solisilvae]